MSTANDPSLSPDLLLRHEPFVRALARNLLQGDDRAHDVVQETWLAALTRPPRSAAAARGWLASVARNASRNTLRGDARRTSREAAAARPERVESTAAIHERLAVQRAVVDAVLRLPEPYRSPVLLRYYEGLTPDAIARRLGRKAPTVRSQLTRALEVLRRDLDDLHEGDRRAWGTALVPFARGRETGLGLKLVLASVGAAVTLPLAWIGAQAFSGTPEPPHLVLEPKARTGTSVLATTAPPAPPTTTVRRAVAASTATREETDDTATSGPPDLEDLPVDQLLALAVQARRGYTAALLEPDPMLRNGYEDLLAQPDTGIVKLLERGTFVEQLTMRGDGAYYSFATRSHDYDDEPDIELKLDSFSSGFAGGNFGMVFDAGDVPLTDLGSDPTPPAWLTEERIEAWELLWSDLGHVPRSTEDRAEELGISRPAAVLEHTYFLRSRLPDEHDHLVAFRTVAVTDDSATLVWRVLATFDVERRTRTTPAKDDTYWWVGPAPEWLAQLEPSELQALLAEIEEVAAPKLLAPPEELVAAHPELVSDPRAGFARLLRQGRYEPLIRLRGGGAFYSFATRSNSYDEEPDLALGARGFTSGFYGGMIGMVLDVGPVGLAAVQASPTRPAWLPANALDAWELLWSDLANAPEGVMHTAHDLGLSRGFSAEIGHTYLVRARLPRKHDLLAAFEVLAEDATGCTLGWRILNQWPMSRER